MRLIEFFVVFVALIGKKCFSKIVVEINRPNGYAELEKAAVNILTSCYVSANSTVLLLGDFPDTFVDRLSSNRSFNVVLIDPSRKSKRYDVRHIPGIVRTMRKVSVLVVITTHREQFYHLIRLYHTSMYNKIMPSVLAIGWSPREKYALCNNLEANLNFMAMFNPQELLNLKLLCNDKKKGLIVHGSNPYTTESPYPWKKIAAMRIGVETFYLLIRDYSEKEICINLDFDKTRDLGGTVIRVMVEIQNVKTVVIDNPWPAELDDRTDENILLRQRNIDATKVWYRYLSFINYTHATVETVYKVVDIGIAYDSYSHDDQTTILFSTVDLDRIAGSFMPFSYPHEISCVNLKTIFRGNKSQLQKILSVIDDFSWIGMGIVYVLTLLFFKLFLRQPLLSGILNLLRLTCNVGLTNVPPNVAPRIYIGCLLFFVVTMQGIFVSNLAALLTQDIPVRQVNSFKDVLELGYKLYLDEQSLIFVTDPALNDRIIVLEPGEDCISHIVYEPKTACLMKGINNVLLASQYKIHIGDCIAAAYDCNRLPHNWVLSKRYNDYLAWMDATGTLVSLKIRVVEERLKEAEQIAAEFIEPRVMNFNDLSFAFVILGIGLALASATFIVELIVYWISRRVKRSPVIDLRKCQPKVTSRSTSSIGKRDAIGNAASSFSTIKTQSRKFIRSFD